MYGRLFHFRFDWDPKTGESCDRVNYGPIDTTASSWIVPGSIEEEEPEPEEEADPAEDEPSREYEYEDRYDYFDRSYEREDTA